MSSKKTFSPISDILKSQLAKIGGEKVSQLALLQKIWPNAVPQTIAEHSRVVEYCNHVLVVSADHPAILSELHLMKGEILAALRTHSPKAAIIDIRFKRELK